MSTTRPDDPTSLRHRALRLRRFADELDRSPALSVGDLGGPNTWQSPRADVCRWLLGGAVAHLRRSADELRWTARRLEARADLLESSAPLSVR